MARERSDAFKLSFHRTFALSRFAVSQILHLVAEFEALDTTRPLSWEVIRARTSLGTVQVEAFRRYTFRTGLVTNKERLTEFGRMVASADPTLAELATQWLMHYHLSAPQGPGPFFWHYVATSCLRIGTRLTSSDVAQTIALAVREQSGQDPKPRIAREAGTVFLGSYAKPEGLSQLRLIQEVERGLYLVTDPSPVPVWVFGFALVDYWERQWGNRITVDLAALFEPGGLSSIFFLGSEAVDEVLGTLQREKLIDVYRVAPPYQVVRQWGSDARRMCLDRAYASN